MAHKVAAEHLSVDVAVLGVADERRAHGGGVAVHANRRRGSVGGTVGRRGVLLVHRRHEQLVHQLQLAVRGRLVGEGQRTELLARILARLALEVPGARAFVVRHKAGHLHRIVVFVPRNEGERRLDERHAGLARLRLPTSDGTQQRKHTVMVM